MNIKKYIIGLLLFTFCFILKADATKLPEDVWNYVKTNLPEANQRFDSVVILKNNIMYIPLYPPATTDVEKIASIYTYPDKKSFKDLPEVILLNNGYAFLKVFKDSSGNYTLTKKDDLPIKVRLGLMPQDMLTPIGLKVPESLKLTLGDLLIPSKDESAITKFDDNTKKSPYSPTVKRNEFIPVTEFKGKKTFINPKNSKFLEVYDVSSPNPLYELKLSAMPKKIYASPSGEIAVVMYWGSKELDILNLKDENVIAKIELGDIPSDMALNTSENIAYVASSEGNTISIVDLNSMKLTKAIKLDQKPYRLSYCEMDKSLSFFDKYLSKVFNITKSGEDYVVQPLGEIENLSKLLSDVADVYAISRTENNIKIFDKNNVTTNRTIDIDKKPTDAVIVNTKLYILCSKEGYLDVFDPAQNKITSRTKLPDGDFYSSISIMPDKKNILLTGVSSKNYLVYNIEKEELSKQQSSYVNISNIVVINKAQEL